MQTSLLILPQTLKIFRYNINSYLGKEELEQKSWQRVENIASSSEDHE
jgi:hypothetical protein